MKTMRSIVFLVIISVCPILQAKENCLQVLSDQFRPCLEDEELKEKIESMALVSLWLEDKSQRYIKYCNKNNIDFSFYLLKAIGKLRPYKNEHYRKAYGRRGGLDEDKDGFSFIALLAFQDVGIIYGEELEEYIRCSWDTSKWPSLYSSASTFFYIISSCLRKKLAYTTALFPRNKSAIVHEKCTPNWLVIEERIKDLLQVVKSSNIHFEKTESLVIENSKIVDEMVDSYSQWIPQNVGWFKDDRLKEIENLVRTELFLDQELSEFDFENNEKITKIARKELSVFPNYVRLLKWPSFSGHQSILWVLQKKSDLTSGELLLLLKNVLNSRRLDRYLQHYERNGSKGGRRKKWCAMKKYLPATSKFLNSYLHIGKSWRSAWDKEVSFKEVSTDYSYSDANELVELYKELFRVIHVDISMPNDIQINALVNTLLVVEEEMAELMEKSEDERNKIIQDTYNTIKRSLPPKCICPNHPFGKMRVLSILIELLGESEQKMSSKSNLVTILRLENLFKLKFPKRGGKHFELKSKLLPHISQVVDVIDKFNFTRKKQVDKVDADDNEDL